MEQAKENTSPSYFDPMSLDFALNSSSWEKGINSEDWASERPLELSKISESGEFDQEITRTKNIPCKFHDGVSGRCFKGDRCKFSHELYNRPGGRFAIGYVALENPDPTSGASREVTSLVNLCPKPLLCNQGQIDCKVTWITTPSEFYIRVAKPSCDCKLKAVEKAMEKERDARGGEAQITDYYYHSSHPKPTNSTSATEKLTKYFARTNETGRWSRGFYIPNNELVAVKMDSCWMRGVVLPTFNFVGKKEDSGKLQVRLLDTGEKVKVYKRHIRQLPLEFCQYHVEAFKCCLFGVSPGGLVWYFAAINLFKELVNMQDVKITVKNRMKGIHIMYEPTPYIVQLKMRTKDGFIDVAEKLIETGYALRWNQTPRCLFGFGKSSSVADDNTVEDLLDAKGKSEEHTE